MILADVNVFINAFRRDAVDHASCRAWLVKTITDNAPFGVAPLALNALIRITTNLRIFKTPSPLEEAFAFCDNVLSQPHCQVVEPGDRHWRLFKKLCVDTATIGPRVTDAWFAALAIESGCEWVTLDRDYARFPGLKWRTP
jgi:toxin-antitoxin system PIN domain toxin